MKYPYAEVEMRTDGTVHDPKQLAKAVDVVKTSGATDVLVMVHGWNNEMAGARQLYEDLDTSLKAVEPKIAGSAGRKIAIIGILWPSIKWADDENVAGGGLGVDDPADDLVVEITARIEDPKVRAKLIKLVPKLDTDNKAQAEYLNLLRDLLPAPVEGDEEPPPATLREGDPETVFTLLGDTAALTGVGEAGAAPGVGGALGFDIDAPGDVGAHAAGAGAAGLSLSGVLGKARELLNTSTYYTMKERAGTVGRVGINQTLQALHTGAPSARLHLVGHSFGARAVTSAAHATPAPVFSVSLLQGAFSHFGIATDYDGQGHDGAFKGVPGKLTGPMIITHTRNDKAVGLAYALASRLAGQVAAAVGDENDIYGGMGSNGAQKTPEAQPDTDLLDVGGKYHFAPKKVANLHADKYVSGHSDVHSPQVANAIYAAITTPA
jgi:hypothetical protein